MMRTSLSAAENTCCFVSSVCVPVELLRKGGGTRSKKALDPSHGHAPHQNKGRYAGGCRSSVDEQSGLRRRCAGLRTGSDPRGRGAVCGQLLALSWSAHARIRERLRLAEIST